MAVPFNEAICKNCADRMKKVIKEIPGVKRADVDFEKKLVAIAYDPGLLDLLDIQQTVSEIGYSFPTFSVVLNVVGMSCISCSARVEGALLNLPGVLDAAVSLTKANVKVTSIKDSTTVSDLVQAIRSVGYQASSQIAN
jgi:Cu+-exporting ATPase